LSQNALTLTANEDSAQYQWYDCNTNQAINGADSQSFTATISGSYYVLINQSGCASNSPCTQIIISGQNDVEDINQLRIYPNPNNGSFLIDLGQSEENISFKIYNLAGQEIPAVLTRRNNQIEAEFNAPAGLYLLKSAKNNTVYKIFKFE
jgi:archaellin